MALGVQRRGIDFFILGVRVHARDLPLNNMTVAHCYYEAVRNTVEPICRGSEALGPEVQELADIRAVSGNCA